VVSTYQSITGTGVKAVEQLEKMNMQEFKAKWPINTIHRNAIPQCDVFEENGYTKEMKLVRETQKY
jgi:aspartate-semialdehyde dehydrogenase